MWMMSTPSASVSCTYVPISMKHLGGCSQQRTFLDVVSADEFLEIYGKTLRRNILSGSCIYGTRDESGDEGYVHHVRETLAQRDDADRDMW